MALIEIWRTGYETSMHAPISSPSSPSGGKEGEADVITLPPINLIPNLDKLELPNFEAKLTETAGLKSKRRSSSSHDENLCSQLQLPEAAKRGVARLRHLLSPANSPFR